MKIAGVAPKSREADDWYYQFYEKERLASIGVLQ